MISLEDISLEDISLEAISLEDISLEDISLEDISLKEISLKEISLEEISLKENPVLVEVMPNRYVNSFSSWCYFRIRRSFGTFDVKELFLDCGNFKM